VPGLTLIHLFAATGHAAEENPAGIAALGIDPLAILAQAGTFLLLFWVVKKFALEKIVKSLEERRQTIDEGVTLGYEMAEERARLEEKVEAELRKTRDKADLIVAEAHKEAGEVVKAAEASAAAKVDDMLADARSRIEDDMKRAKQELQKDILGFVADATEAIIGEKLDAKKDDALIKRALKAVK
jgi:F-type H+-transporting ATPase subunit b